METIAKVDAEYISEKFYVFYDKVWEVVREMKKLQDEVEELSSHYSKEEISLNHYCIARHDRKIIVANFYSSRSNNKEIQFPLYYLYDENWQEDYRNKLVMEKENVVKSREAYSKQRDLDEIARLKKLYPDVFRVNP